jgi:hypothetical protein
MNSQDQRPGEIDDPVLNEALNLFKSNVDAWSEAAYHRPRTVERRVSHRGWRLAAGWALGCALAIGCLAGGVFERQHRQELARIAALKTAQKTAHERMVAAEAAAATHEALVEQPAVKRAAATAKSSTSSDQSLLAAVDTDVSREVPAAMEPLAQLMDDGGSQ